MSVRKAPAVQMYAEDFLGGTRFMSNAETGLYARLLMEQVDKGHLPDSAEHFAKAYGKEVLKLWPAVRAKFIAGPEPGTMVNERMAQAIAARDAHRLKQSEKGKLSAASRSKTVQPRINNGSTVVEPLGDGDTVLVQGRKEQARELVWPTWAGEKCKAKWAEFIAYRFTEKKARYKSAVTEQKALDLAARYFPTGPQFVAGLEHTMAKGWQFPVDPAEAKYPAPTDTAKPQGVWNML